jgi:hypothetical protein
LQRVFIKDIGSLHGTFYNDTRLKKHQSQAVKNGDLIQFGVPIDRGSDTCPPCIMRATIQFGALRYASTLLSSSPLFNYPSNMPIVLLKARPFSECQTIAMRKLVLKKIMLSEAAPKFYETTVYVRTQTASPLEIPLLLLRYLTTKWTRHPPNPKSVQNQPGLFKAK